jgi:nitrite reductase/ring-hydroxylating ferredoxin subunit
MSLAKPPGWAHVGSLNDFQPHTVREVQLHGVGLAIVNLDGKLYALNGTCPHREGPLARGKLVSNELACPWHGFRFDPATGKTTMPSGYDDARTYPVRLRGDAVEVNLGGAPGR